MQAFVETDYSGDKVSKLKSLMQNRGLPQRPGMKRDHIVAELHRSDRDEYIRLVTQVIGGHATPPGTTPTTPATAPAQRGAVPFSNGRGQAPAAIIDQAANGDGKRPFLWDITRWAFLFGSGCLLFGWAIIYCINLLGEHKYMTYPQVVISKGWVPGLMMWLYTILMVAKFVFEVLL